MELNFNHKLFIKRASLLLLLLSAYILVEVAILYLLLISQAKSNLEKITNRIREDVVLRNGAWDVSLYNSDNEVSNENPLYIITSEGFIIERSRPIHGLLDLSRYSLIIPYTTPTTVDIVTSEKWRVLSSPVLAEDKPVGVIMVSSYKPDEKNLPEIDKQLQDVISIIQSNIAAKGDFIDLSNLNVRKIPYNINFQIVSRFNKVLIQSNNNNSVNRIPTYIDRSYIEIQLKGNPEKQVEDSLNHKKYLTLTTPIFDEKKLTAGIIIAGTPIDGIYSSLATFAYINFLISIFLITISIPVANLYIKKIRKNNKNKVKEKTVPKIIMFMKKACKLDIDGQIIDIPYASYQYYFCNTLFLKPQKKWENDELLEVFGEDFGVEKWRKVYDTMIALNRKTSHLVDKLFIVKDKRYFLNPELTQSVKFSDV